MEGKIFAPFFTIDHIHFFFPRCCTNIANFQTYEFKDKNPIGRDLWLISAWNKDDQPDCFRTAAVSSLSMQRTTHKNRKKWCIFFVNPWLLQFQIISFCTVHILFCGGFFVLCITGLYVDWKKNWWLDRENSKESHWVRCVLPCVQTIDIWWFLSNFSF